MKCKDAIFRTIKPLETSVEDAEFEKEVECNKQLKEFLCRTLQLKAGKKGKILGRSIGTCVHAAVLMRKRQWLESINARLE